MSWKSEEDYEFEDEMTFWNPEAGESLQGEVKKVQKGTYEKYFIILEDDEGKTWATTQCARLDYQIKKMKIVENDYILLEYNGQRAEDNAHDYKLYVDRDD